MSNPGSATCRLSELWQDDELSGSACWSDLVNSVIIAESLPEGCSKAVHQLLEVASQGWGQHKRESYKQETQAGRSLCLGEEDTEI